MNVVIKQKVRKYYVGFELDRSKVWMTGRYNGKQQAVTTCKIWLTGGLQPELVATGVARLGKKDTFNAAIGMKLAFTRALENAKLGKEANDVFWQCYRATAIHTPTQTGSAGKAAELARFYGIKAYPEHVWADLERRALSPPPGWQRSIELWSRAVELYESKFEIGQVVTHDGHRYKVTKVEGPVVTVQKLTRKYGVAVLLEKKYTFIDVELEAESSWFRRLCDLVR